MERFLRSNFVFFDEQRLRSLRAVDMYDEGMQLIGFVNTFCGTFLMHPDWRWNHQTWVSLFLVVTFLFNLGYSVYVNWYDWYAILDVLSVSGIGFQGIAKFIGCMSRVEYFQKVNRELRLMYLKYAKHPENNYVLLRCTLLIMYFCRYIAVIYASAGLLVWVMPVYKLVTGQGRTLPIPLSFVFTDSSTLVGYIINAVYLGVAVSFAIMGIVAADTAIMHIILQIIGISDVFKNHLKELDQMLEDPHSSQEEINVKVTEICKIHKEIIEYEENLDSAFHSQVFVQVITSVTGLSLTLFLLYMKHDWTKVMFFLASIFQLLEFCMLGTSLTLKNQEIMTAIYDTKWYLLSVSDQKRLLIILHRSQNAVEMTVGGLYLLNIETFVEIIKTIYSYFTMLASFLE